MPVVPEYVIYYFRPSFNPYFLFLEVMLSCYRCSFEMSSIFCDDASHPGLLHHLRLVVVVYTTTSYYCSVSPWFSLFTLYSYCRPYR